MMLYRIEQIASGSLIVAHQLWKRVTIHSQAHNISIVMSVSRQAIAKAA